MPWETLNGFIFSKTSSIYLYCFFFIFLIYFSHISHICCSQHNSCVFFFENFQAWQLKWRIINCLLIGLFEQCITRQISTWGKFLKNIRSPQSVRPRCMFHCVGWFPCPLLNMFSRLISWRWSKPFHMGCREGKETRVSTCFQLIWRVRMKILVYTMTLGMSISSLRSCYRTT